MTIAETLKAVLDAITLPVSKPKRRVLVPGNEVVWDDCCDGQLAMKVISIVPKGDPKCITGWDATLGLSLIACVATVNDRGQAPSAAQINADGLRQLTMMEELRDALQEIPETVKPVLRLTLLSWLPQGPQGGCAGGEWQVRLFLSC